MSHILFVQPYFDTAAQVPPNLSLRMNSSPCVWNFNLKTSVPVKLYHINVSCFSFVNLACVTSVSPMILFDGQKRNYPNFCSYNLKNTLSFSHAFNVGWSKFTMSLSHWTVVSPCSLSLLPHVSLISLVFTVWLIS